MYTFWSIYMPNVTAGYGRFPNSIAFFKKFSYIKRYNSIKLLQIVCRTEKEAYVIIYGYVSLVFLMKMCNIKTYMIIVIQLSMGKIMRSIFAVNSILNEYGKR